MPAWAGFPRQARLLKASEFSRVFQKPNKSFYNGFTVFWRENGLDRARLGLAISKKNARRAVDRNRLKRLIRESFRLKQDQLAGFDIVIMNRRGVVECSNRDIHYSLEHHWERIIQHG